MKKLTSLLLALALLALSAGLCESAPMAQGIVKMTQTFYDADGGVDSTFVLYYGEDGLPLSAMTTDADDAQTIYFYCDSDDRGGPERVRVDTGDQLVELVFANTYDGGTLVSAELSGLLAEGEDGLPKMAESIGPGMSYSVFSILNAAVSILQNAACYGDAEITLAGCDSFSLRLVGGRLASSRIPSPMGVTETEYTYAPDGGSTVAMETALWTEDGAEPVVFSRTASTRDADGRLTQAVYSVDGEPVTVTFRYQDSIDPATGGRLLLGFIDSVDGLPEDINLGPEMQLDTNRPYLRYALNDEGWIERFIQGDQTEVYDARGRLLRLENGYEGSVRSVIEYEYRD